MNNHRGECLPASGYRKSPELLRQGNVAVYPNCYACPPPTSENSWPLVVRTLELQPQLQRRLRRVFGGEYNNIYYCVRACWFREKLGTRETLIMFMLPLLAIERSLQIQATYQAVLHQAAH